jgi:large subunit ribosomal protein L9
MKLLLRKDIPHLGLAGDMVEVKPGYARNYLLPHHLALEPTPANLKKIEEDKRLAALDRARHREMLERQAERVAGMELTIAAAANPEGHLYGSVGPREIVSALLAEGIRIEPDQVKLKEHIKQLDTRTVTIGFTEDLTAEIKIWVVREKTAADLDQPPVSASASEGAESPSDSMGA